MNEREQILSQLKSLGAKVELLQDAPIEQIRGLLEGIQRIKQGWEAENKSRIDMEGKYTA